MTEYYRGDDGRLYMKDVIEEIQPFDFYSEYEPKEHDAHTKYNRPPNAPANWGRGKSFAARQRRQRRIAWGFPE